MSESKSESSPPMPGVQSQNSVLEVQRLKSKARCAKPVSRAKLPTVNSPNNQSQTHHPKAGLLNTDAQGSKPRVPSQIFEPRNTAAKTGDAAQGIYIHAGVYILETGESKQREYPKPGIQSRKSKASCSKVWNQTKVCSTVNLKPSIPRQQRKATE